MFATIHESYVEAGAEVLTTNSYGANFNKLSKFGLAEKLGEINRAAVRIARGAAGDSVLVAASVGPIGDLPRGTVYTRDNAVAMIQEQIRALAEESPDFILFETMRSLADVEIAVAAMNAVPEMPFMVSVQVDAGAETATGDSVAAILAFLRKCELQPTGVWNHCGSGPEAMLTALEQFAHHCPYPIVVQPMRVFRRMWTTG